MADDAARPDASALWRENQRLRVRIAVLEGEMAGTSGMLKGIASVMRDEGDAEAAEFLEERAERLWTMSTPRKEVRT